MSAVVYRMYDANYKLLYVGMSADVMQRIANHSNTADWFEQVDTVSIEHFATRAEALAAERAAIIAEGPKYNVRHSRRPQPQYEYVNDGSPQRLNLSFLQSLWKIDGTAPDDLASLTGWPRDFVAKIWAGEARLFTFDAALHLAHSLNIEAGALFGTMYKAEVDDRLDPKVVA